MSELIQKNDNRATIRWKLLTGASALALTAYVASAGLAYAADADHPLLWIELGGQFDRQTGLGEMYVPPFVSDYADSPAFNPISPSKAERVPLYSQGFDAAISFTPNHSDWVLSAGIRYGRASHNRDFHQGKIITDVEPFTRAPKRDRVHGGWYPPVTGHFTKQVYEFGGIQVQQSQKHTILDFSAGRDVGLGMLGTGSTSTVDVGVRFAQFVSNSKMVMHARPDALFSDPCNAYLQNKFATIFPSRQFCFPRSPEFHTFSASFDSERKFDGVGPSLSWNASMPVAGNPEDEALTVDWGINAAVLFGRQRAKGRHQAHGSFYGAYGVGTPTAYSTAKTFDRSRRVTVPNVGAMLGMSLEFSNAKISIGYRGDFFFGAMDQGVDTRKTGITGFYGPFASISFGIGD